MDIDLRVLKLMETEKGIPFDELVEIIEQAILTAYLKHTGRDDHRGDDADGGQDGDGRTGEQQADDPALDPVAGPHPRPDLVEDEQGAKQGGQQERGPETDGGHGLSSKGAAVADRL